MSVNVNPVRGTREFLYQEMLLRDYVQGVILDTYRECGFNRIGTPALVVLMTSTVSHKLVESALQEAKRRNIPVARSRSSSASALQGVLSQHFAPATS